MAQLSKPAVKPSVKPMQTILAPSKPAPQAPAKAAPAPVKPGKPGANAGAAIGGALPQPAKAAPATPASTGVSLAAFEALVGRFAALETANAKLTTLLEKANEKAAKHARPETHFDGYALAGEDPKGIDPSDWRLAYHGATVKLYASDVDASGGVSNVETQSCECVLLVPQGNMPSGAIHLRASRVAVCVLDENGQGAFGDIAYLTQESLAALWAD
jgi:hypothetical protein